MHMKYYIIKHNHDPNDGDNIYGFRAVDEKGLKEYQDMLDKVDWTKAHEIYYAKQ